MPHTRLVPILEKEISDDLRAAVNPSGGWGYSIGKASRLEPTSWALLALGGDAARAEELQAHRRFLTSHQLESGLLSDDSSAPISVSCNALAAVALLSLPGAVPETSIQALLNALVTVAGPSPEAATAIIENEHAHHGTLVDADGHWVEPTAWVVLALKTARARGLAPAGSDARIAAAERRLLAHSVETGGWSSGYTEATGGSASPSVTALVLLAMQNHREEPAILLGLDFLEQHWSEEESTIGLALAVLGLRRYGKNTSRVESKLLQRLPMAQMLGYLQALAVVLHAIDARSHHAAFVF